MHSSTERRRHKRFEMKGTRSKLAWVDRSGRELSLENCELIDISVGGIGFITDQDFAEGDTGHFLVDLREPLKEMVFVKARVQWVHPRGEDTSWAGAQFLESSKGWLGELDTVH